MKKQDFSRKTCKKSHTKYLLALDGYFLSPHSEDCQKLVRLLNHKYMQTALRKCAIASALLLVSISAYGMTRDTGSRIVRPVFANIKVETPTVLQVYKRQKSVPFTPLGSIHQESIRPRVPAIASSRTHYRVGAGIDGRNGDARYYGRGHGRTLYHRHW